MLKQAVRLFQAIVAALLLSVGSVAADAALVEKFVSADELYGYCKTPETAQTCLAYIVGVADSMLVENSNAGRCVSFAPPLKTTSDKLQEVALRYLEVHPELRTAAAAPVIRLAFREFYPCEN